LQLTGKILLEFDSSSLLL